MPNGRHTTNTRVTAAQCVAALLALAGCAADPSACHPQLVAVLQTHPPFVVATRINGHLTDLLIDTGSFENILTTTAVTRLALHTDQLLDDVDVPIGYALRGVGGRRHYDRVEAATLDAAALHRQGIQFAALWSGYAPWDVDGLLGMSLLADYDLDLNTPVNQVVLYHPGSECGAALNAVALLRRDRPTSPMVAADLDGRHVVALLDTGAEHSVLFTRSPPAAATAANAKLQATGIGPAAVGAAMHVFAVMHIGSLALRNVSVIEVDQARPGDADLLLGLDFFRRVHVILSPVAGTAWLEYPPLPSPGPLAPAPAG